MTDPTIAEQPGANRSALTLGLSYLFDLNTTFKVEYRLDSANLPVFVQRQGRHVHEEQQPVRRLGAGQLLIVRCRCHGRIAAIDWHAQGRAARRSTAAR